MKVELLQLAGEAQQVGMLHEVAAAAWVRSRARSCTWATPTSPLPSASTTWGRSTQQPTGAQPVGDVALGPAQLGARNNARTGGVAIGLEPGRFRQRNDGQRQLGFQTTMCGLEFAQPRHP